MPRRGDVRAHGFHPIRAGVVAALLSIILLATWLIAYRVLDPQGAGYWFYQFHDRVFLPVYGHTWTRFYPFGMVWWGLAAVLLAVRLFSFVTGRSLLTLPHTLLLKAVVAKAAWHEMLYRGARLFLRSGFQPLLLRETVRRQYIVNRTLFLEEQHAGDDYVSISRLLIRLLLLSDTTPEQNLEALCYAKEVDSIMRFHNRTVPWDDLFIELATRLFTWTEPGRFHAAEALPAGYDLDSIMVDMIYLAGFEGRQTVPLLGMGVGKDPERLMDRRVIHRLSNSLASRTGWLNQLRVGLERDLFPNRPRIPRTRLEGMEGEGGAESARADLLARLSFYLALDLAMLTECSNGVESHAAALEALDFTVQLVVADPDDQVLTSVVLDRIRAIVSTVPGTTEQFILADLVRRGNEEVRREWSASDLRTTGLISLHDLQRDEAKAESMARAAGPTFSAK